MRSMMLFPTYLVLIVVASVQLVNVSAKPANDHSYIGDGQWEIQEDGIVREVIVKPANDQGTDALPGRDKSPAQQCRDRLSESVVCETNPAERCAKLQCGQVRGDGDRPDAEDEGPALDGTWCGDNKICLHGSCINDPQPPKDVRRPEEREYDCIFLDDLDSVDFILVTQDSAYVPVIENQPGTVAL